MDDGDGTEFAIGEVEAGAEGIAEGFGGGVEEVGEEVASLAEDAAQHLGNGEDELAMVDFVADGCGDPVAGGWFARGVSCGDGGAGIWMAQMMFLRTFFMRSKIGSDGSVWGKIKNQLPFRFTVTDLHHLEMRLANAYTFALNKPPCPHPISPYPLSNSIMSSSFAPQAAA